MSDERGTEPEIAQAFASHLADLSRRYRQPLPGAAERLEQLLADHETECMEVERDETERERPARTA